ncbi:MAG TPA: hypothetical protein VHR88_07700 [Solirubrobacteraceae bacterium]|nr:hypothetical protein [Solirubrobacteraceae bacterium]
MSAPDGMAPRRASDVSPQMLLITAGASVLAALITSSFWSGGTVISAAFTPVFIAVVKEGMRRPSDRMAERVRRRAPVPPPRRPRPRPAVEAEAHELPPDEHRGPGEWTEITLHEEPAPEPQAPATEPLPSPEPEPEPEPELEPDPGPEPASPQRGGLRFQMTPRRWRIALITGGLGFLIAAAVITLPELVFGKSLTGGNSLTYFPATQVSSDRGSDQGTTSTSTTSTATGTTATTTPTQSTATSTTPTTTTGTQTSTTTGTETTGTGTTAQPSLAPPPTTNTTGTTGTTGTSTSSPGGASSP